jgi:MFS family permease
MYSLSPAPNTNTNTTSQNPDPKKTPTEAQTKIPSIVYFIGLTSLLTDVSSEMVASILPTFLFSSLHLSFMQIGFIDGIYQSFTHFFRVLVATFTDKLQRYKKIAFIGYFLSSIAKLFLILSLSGIVLFIYLSLLFDRIGKGIRSSPRDALIIDHTPQSVIHYAFGVHRSMDAVGALLGPLLATAILFFFNQNFQLVFIISLIFGVLGLLSFGFFVHDKKSPNSPLANKLPANSPTENSPLSSVTTTANHNYDASSEATTISLRSVFLELFQFFKSQKLLSPFIIFLLLNCFVISDGMLFLTIQQQFGLQSYSVGLMMSLVAASYVASAFIFGKMADKWGVGKILLLGYSWLPIAYFLVLITPPEISFFDLNPVWLVVLLIGLFYGATDGVITAQLGKALPKRILITGLAIFTSFLAFAKFLSSIMFAYVLQEKGFEFSFMLYTILLFIIITSLVIYQFFNKNGIQNETS